MKKKMKGRWKGKEKLLLGIWGGELLGSVGITSLDLEHRSPSHTQPKSRFAQQDLLHKDMG